MKTTPYLLLSLTTLGCVASPGEPVGSQADEINTVGYNALNLAAGSQVLYEIQVRTANACHPDVGSALQKAACAKKIAPANVYRAEGVTCGELDALHRIKLGTLDDLMADTADYRDGITLRYVKEKVSATMVWLMPVFPNNDQWSLPDACDNLGSPYAVRDYFHAAGSLSRACIAAGRDEHSTEPCNANPELDALIQKAHEKGLKVMLDVAFNHFGHNYAFYDQAEGRTVRDRAFAGENLDALWSFDATYDEAHLHPEVLDTEAKLAALAKKSPADAKLLAELGLKCPALTGDDKVRGFAMYRDAFDWERSRFGCDPKKNFLEHQIPAYYTGVNRFDPARFVGDNFTNNWRDVKFLYHHEENTGHYWEFVREREYLFRVMNYWVSRGVDGFRLDHTTDGDSGMGSNEWKYLTEKVSYYANKRGQKRPIFLAEEFHDQLEINKVTDIMTDGYVGDMCGRNGANKNTSRVEGILEAMNRFDDHAFVMTALETHDEHRLTDGTGFNVWTGAGFWGIGATTRSTPMLLMGQELGEGWGLAFRKSDFLRARFADDDRSSLVGYYRSMIAARLAPENRALLMPGHAYLRSRWTNQPDQRLFAQVKWGDGNVVFIFHNLWEQDVAQSYTLDDWLAGTLGIRNDGLYRLVDALSGKQAGACRKGFELKGNFYVSMDRGTRAQWLRLELCT